MATHAHMHGAVGVWVCREGSSSKDLGQGEQDIAGDLGHSLVMSGERKDSHLGPDLGIAQMGSRERQESRNKGFNSGGLHGGEMLVSS